MQYKDLIEFKKIETVIKLSEAHHDAVAENLVKTYVFSERMKEVIEKTIVRNLNPKNQAETKGIQIVGSYGTGKSHLMSLVSLIAEDASLLDKVNDEKVKELFFPIAGKFKSLRFEVANTNALKDIVWYHIETYLANQNVDFQFDPLSKKSYKEQLQEMMSAFEQVYPDKFFLLVIDELLEYLKSRDNLKLNEDLMLLRQLGEMCDRSRFRMLYGVQELVYRAPEFQFATEMLGKVRDRSDDVIITKEDVSFVIKQRLLVKNTEQKQKIKAHLEKFTHLFEHLANNLNEYVEMFPVHPRYIFHFEQIRMGKSQREILKVLSGKFEEILEQEVPNNALGLITYDTYWSSIMSDASLTSDPDVRAVKGVTEIIKDKIENHFTGAKAGRKPIAKAIADALSINILSDVLQKKNGAAPKELKDDLCLVIPPINDGKMLLQMVTQIAKDLASATSGQYIDENPNNGEFHIRTEGGRNFDQDIKSYADTQIKNTPNRANDVFFDFLSYVLQLNQSNSHKTGFNIWKSSLQWVEKKSFREGYIFFGNPGDKTTTHPILHYYVCFAPIFGTPTFTNEPDEIYFDLSGLNEEFREILYTYGAAKSLMAASPSTQKGVFEQKIEEALKKAAALFNAQYVDATKVVYKNNPKSLRSFPLPQEGTPVAQVYSDVAARELDFHFNDKFPDYPAFKDLIQPISKDNYSQLLQATFSKIANTNSSNRGGEAILSGLGLWSGANLDIQNSRYAKSILTKLQQKGVGQVLNRDEILECADAQYNLWYSRDFRLDDALEFVVLAALVQMGRVELHTGSILLNATNIAEVTKLKSEDYYAFRHVAAPKNMNLPALKALFRNLGMDDYTLGNGLDNDSVYGEMKTKALQVAEEVAKVIPTIQQGIKCRTLDLLDDTQRQQYSNDLTKLQEVADKIATYNNKGKLNNFAYQETEINQVFEAKNILTKISLLKNRANKFNQLAAYLQEAVGYLGLSQDDTLQKDINQALQEELPAKLASGNDVALRQFEASLLALKDRYAQYYMAQYQKYCLKPDDFLKKQALWESDAKKLCNSLQGVNFINFSDFEKWCDKMDRLKAQAVALTINSIKETPYHGFNPKDSEGQDAPSVRKLEDDLVQVFEMGEHNLLTFLKDPSIQDNAKTLLKSNEYTLLQGYWAGAISLSLDNVNTIVKAANELSKGIEIIELSIADLQQRFGQPQTPEDVINQFNQLIDQLCQGKKRDEVRILLK